MKPNETDDRYFYERATQELKLAQESNNPAAVAVHYELAERYLNRIDADDDETKE